jgi:hypothetical protein
MGSCVTPGGREWDDVGGEVDACFLKGQLQVLFTGSELMSGGSNGIDGNRKVPEIRINGDDRSTSIA